MRVLVWIFRLAVFFTLFAFALNNQHETTIHWFFGQHWQGPMVFIVLIAFGLGCAFGVLAMVPNWWRQRRGATNQNEAMPPEPRSVRAVDSVLPQPPRDGL